MSLSFREQAAIAIFARSLLDPVLNNKFTTSTLLAVAGRHPGVAKQAIQDAGELADEACETWGHDLLGSCDNFCPRCGATRDEVEAQPEGAAMRKETP